MYQKNKQPEKRKALPARTETLIRRYGPTYFSDLAKKVKHRPGGNFKDPTIARLAQVKSVAARKKKNRNEDK